MKRLECIPSGSYTMEIMLNDYNEEDSGLNIEMKGENNKYIINFGYVAGFKRIKRNGQLSCGMYMLDNDDEFVRVMKKWMGGMYDENQKEYLLVSNQYCLFVLGEWDYEIKVKA